MSPLPQTLSLSALFLPILIAAQGQSLLNNLTYARTAGQQTVQSFQGVYSSNFNETITFCNFKEKRFELNTWDIIPVIAQSADSRQYQYNERGALLYGGVYTASNSSIIWKGLGFSQNGPYDAAFALGRSGKLAYGYYTFLGAKNGSTSAGETGPWNLYYEGAPSAEACNLVYRTYLWGFSDSVIGRM